MKPRKPFKLSLISLALMGLVTAQFARGQNVAVDDAISGGYRDADPTSPEVITAAKFAIATHNFNALGVELIFIKSVQLQIVAGFNYQLCLSVRQKSEPYFVTVVVYENLDQKLELSQWNKTPC